jgi:hypothetical protein
MVMMFVVLGSFWVIDLPEGVSMSTVWLFVLFPEVGSVISMMAASVRLFLLSLFMLRLLVDMESVEEFVCKASELFGEHAAEVVHESVLSQDIVSAKGWCWARVSHCSDDVLSDVVDSEEFPPAR